MSDKKHIDRIFQEKLKDFEVSPNPELWGKIQNELNLEKEEPKKVIPIWLRIASIAAVLAILITVGSFVFDGESNTLTPDSNTVDTHTDSNNATINELDNNSLNNNLENNVASDDQINQPDNASLDNTSEHVNTRVVLSETDNTPKSQSEIVTSPSHFSSTNNVAESNNSEKEPSDSNNVEKQNSSNSQSSGLNKENFTNTIESSVAQSNSSNSDKLNDNSNELNNENDSSNNKESSNKKSKLSNPFIKTESQATQVADNLNNDNSSKSTNKPLHKNQVSSNTSVSNSTVSPSNSNAELDKQAVDNALGNEKTQEAVVLNAMKGDAPHNEKEKEDNQKVGDSLATGESPSIEEEIAQLDSINEEEKEKLVNRWQVAANAAPVYYNSLGNGSHIDEQFVSNSKSGEVNMSYGVNVSYALSKKLSVRSGINSLNLSYDTDDVILYEMPSGNNSNPANPLKNINLSPQSQSLNAFSADNLGVQQINNNLFDANAAISQRLSYYEVPVELEYKLVNNRFGLNIIGGVSTFFLDGNEVYSEYDDYKTYIGEANNVNNVSFSTNLGIGMNYKFSEALKFNLEPTFKYQLNGFENTSGNFRPYIIGVYTGFSYRF